MNDPPPAYPHSMLDEVYAMVADHLVANGYKPMADGIDDPLLSIRQWAVHESLGHGIRAIISVAHYMLDEHFDVHDLNALLSEAREQALGGKGQARHADGTGCFDDEHWMKVVKIAGDGFLLGQAAKKIMESERLSPAHARVEVLGAINYLAFAAILDVR